MNGPGRPTGRRSLAIVLFLAALLSLAVACSRVCPACSGEGVQRVMGTCPTCAGSGSATITCKDCNGHGRLGAGSPCPRCKGRRIVVCNYTAFLDLMVSEGNASEGSCPRYEKVSVACKEGRLEPSEPSLNDRQLQVLFQDNPGRNCPQCMGVGQLTCSFCGGTGLGPGSEVCTACRGSGQVTGTCPTCGGSGRTERTNPCPRCEGKGRVSRLSL